MVCDAAIKWLSADIESRKANAEELLATLRIPLCTSEYIMKNLCHNPVLAALEGSKEAIQEAFVYRMCPSKKQTFSSASTTHRATSKRDDVLVIMGGADTSDYTGSGMRCYSFLRRKWFTLPSLPENVGPHYATCTFGDDIFVSGGQYHREGFYKFQASTCSWFSLAKMPTGRYQHAMVSLSDAIYTIGGEGVNSKCIEQYQVGAVCWERCGELLDGAPHAVATVCNQTILIFGGNCVDNESVQRFDTVSRQVTRIEHVKPSGPGSRVITCGSISYIVSPNGHVVVASDKKSSSVGSIVNFSEQKFGMTQYRGNFYIVSATKASSKQPTDTSKIQVISPKTLHSVETISIPPTPGNLPWLCNGTRLACCRIVLSKHYLQDNEINQVYKKR